MLAVLVCPSHGIISGLLILHYLFELLNSKPCDLSLICMGCQNRIQFYQLHVNHMKYLFDISSNVPFQFLSRVMMFVASQALVPDLHRSMGCNKHYLPLCTGFLAEKEAAIPGM